MRPNIKVVRIPSNKKLLCFLGDAAEFEHCKKKGCELITDSTIMELDPSVSSPAVLSDLAIEMWRLEKRLNKIKAELNEKLGQDAESIFDQVRRIKDCFAKYFIEIKEHTGESYNDGLSLKAIHFETDENLPKGMMQIIETVKPSIYLKGSIILHGEVVVAKSKES